MIFRLGAPVLSLLMLAAHFFRGGAFVVAALMLAVVALLAVRRRWAVRLVQVVLVLGAIEWVATLMHHAFWRAAAGEPVIRLVLILAAVAAFTVASAFVFRGQRLREFYRLDHPSRPAPTKT